MSDIHCATAEIRRGKKKKKKKERTNDRMKIYIYGLTYYIGQTINNRHKTYSSCG